MLHKEQSPYASSNSSRPVRGFSNSELLTSIQTLVKEERRITREILERINEVSRRGLHLELGYPSVFEWLTQELGYSHSAAYRRLEAARLLQSVPEVSQKIETGNLTLSALARLQTAFRHEEKRTGERITLSRKAELVRKIEKTSCREAEKIIHQELPLGVPQHETLRQLDGERSRLNLTLEDRLLRKIKRVQELRSHATPQASFAEIIDFLATEYLKRKDPEDKLKRQSLPANFNTIVKLEARKNSSEERNPKGPNSLTAESSEKSPRRLQNTGATKGPSKLKKTSSSPSANPPFALHQPPSVLQSTAGAAATGFKTPSGNSKKTSVSFKPTPSENSPKTPVSLKPTTLLKPAPPLKPTTRLRRALPAAVRRHVFARDGGCCSWVSPQTGRRCASRYRLELDHIKPLCLGGIDARENLRLICGAHHARLTRQSFAEKSLATRSEVPLISGNASSARRRP